MCKGKVIAAFGIPGSGKTSTIRELAFLLRCCAFHEPEEPDWGEAVKMRATVGNFTSVMWFRACRIPMVYKADQVRKDGKVALLDSFYDKLFNLYFDKKGIEWFYDRDDNYFEEMTAISKKDYELLPDADILIFFHLDELCWKKFIAKRGREMDCEETFKNSYHLQEVMLDAAHRYCKERNVKLIIHNQKDSSPKEEAIKLCEIIKATI